MVKRPFWLRLLRQAWAKRPILWLTGLRRAGKTSLARMLPHAEYFDCELPRARLAMQDPEAFLEGLRGKNLVLDEIHRLRQPAELLKIAADHFKDIKILATGSSTLAASRKFRDTLAGRKHEVWLTPMGLADLKDFKRPDLPARFLKGGLPPFFLQASSGGRDYQEWLDSFWAKDIQELFRFGQRDPFMKLLELLLINSGGMFEASAYARQCEVDRKTILNYLRALEITHTAHIVRPFSTRKTYEIVSAPKVYGFDTGFICYFRGWDALRPDDCGILWEHFVLNELHACLQTRRIHYWRDKLGHEIDFVLERRGGPPVALECKWSLHNAGLKSFHAFAAAYPGSTLLLAANDIHNPVIQKSGPLRIECLNLPDLIQKLQTMTNLAL